MFKFDNSRVIGSLIVLFIFFVVFVSSIGVYVQRCRETMYELQLDNRDLRERVDILGFEIRELEDEIYELRTKNAVLNDQINQINANKEAEKYLNPSKEAGEWMSFENMRNVEMLRSQYYEPEENSPIAYDWEGNDLYEGDEVFLVNGEYVLDTTSEIERYIIENYERMELGN